MVQESLNEEAVDLTQTGTATGPISTAIGWTDGMGTRAFAFGCAIAR